MHTVEQAKALWCPMARIARDESITIEKAAIGEMVHVTEQRHIVGGCNTDARGDTRVPSSCRCIADQCAMWRWGTYIAPPLGAEPGKLVEGVNHRAEWGYCGLAPLH